MSDINYLLPHVSLAHDIFAFCHSKFQQLFAIALWHGLRKRRKVRECGGAEKDCKKSRDGREVESWENSKVGSEFREAEDSVMANTTR